jgi:hypothetical protein
LPGAERLFEHGLPIRPGGVKVPEWAASFRAACRVRTDREKSFIVPQISNPTANYTARKNFIVREHNLFTTNKVAL